TAVMAAPPARIVAMAIRGLIFNIGETPAFVRGCVRAGWVRRAWPCSPVECADGVDLRELSELRPSDGGVGGPFQGCAIVSAGPVETLPILQVSPLAQRLSACPQCFWEQAERQSGHFACGRGCPALTRLCPLAHAPGSDSNSPAP